MSVMSYRRLPARVYMGRAYGVRGLGRGLGQDSQGDDTAINTYLQTGGAESANVNRLRAGRHLSRHDHDLHAG